MHDRCSSKVETGNCPTRRPLASPRGVEGYLTLWVMPERRRLLPHTTIHRRHSARLSQKIPGEDSSVAKKSKKKTATCDAPSTKKMSSRRFFHKSTTGSTSTCVFFVCDIPSLCDNFSYTFDPKMHHPAMDS